MDTRVSSPWFVGNWPDGTDAISVRAESPEGPRIASCGGAYRFATSEANAAYIVEACNNYESLTAERDTLKALCVEWKPIETAPQCGVFLVYLEAEMLGSRIHVANWHLNVKIVGGVFSFDAPNPTHWQPLPPPPCGSEGK